MALLNLLHLRLSEKRKQNFLFYNMFYLKPKTKVSPIQPSASMLSDHSKFQNNLKTDLFITCAVIIKPF